MTVISLSLTNDLLTRLDQFVKELGYSSRSEALRLAIRDVLTDYKLTKMQRGELLSTVTIISESEETSTHLGLIDLRNGFDEIIFGNMHLHIEGGYCIEIFLVKGPSEEILSFVNKSKAIRGVIDVNHTLTPMT
ncbi:ribbon-helix-helix protein, CopG family [Candidatus Bathyarchaeota archaeon]|nr:ribbon-helix-helix protein, CopG family [Candidatus Bathyarchaeota archaeon]